LSIVECAARVLFAERLQITWADEPPDFGPPLIMTVGREDRARKDAGRRTPGEEPEAPAASKPTGADGGDEEQGGTAPEHQGVSPFEGMVQLDLWRLITHAQPTGQKSH
jgi:hypothetical protein